MNDGARRRTKQEEQEQKEQEEQEKGQQHNYSVCWYNKNYWQQPIVFEWYFATILFQGVHIQLKFDATD